jgi:predicted nucleic acid-binding protein
MEHHRTIIDTDILIDFLTNRKESVAFVTQLEKKKTILSSTAINAFELYYGAHKSHQSAQTLQATKNLLDPQIEGTIEIVTLTYLDLNYLAVGRKSLCMQTTSIVYCGYVDPQTFSRQSSS